MPLDRQSIQKRDFPISRRGYDTEAVDQHLAFLAREIEALQDRVANAEEDLGSASVAIREQNTATSLAGSASDHVRQIVQAAESSAIEIERQARGEAARIQGDADADARKLRENADREARAVREEAQETAKAHVAGVHQGTTLMMQRVEALESELGGLVDHLRAATHRVRADLTLLHNQVGEIGGIPLPGELGATSRPALTTKPSFDESPAIVDTQLDDEIEVLDADGAVDPAPEAINLDEVKPATPTTPEASVGDDARMVVLNMIIDGDDDATIDAFIAKNYEVADRAALIKQMRDQVS